MYKRQAYDFEGRRYDVGNKLGFLEATVDFALKRPELREMCIRDSYKRMLL